MDDLDTLVAALNEELGALTEQAMRGNLDIAQWRDEVEALLAVGFAAAYQQGDATTTLTPEIEALLEELLIVQLGFLAGFVDAVEERGWLPRDISRAGSYAGSVKQAYWRGKAGSLPLPFYPGDGSSECLGNCYCRWRIDWLDEANGDADAYWELGASEDHCQTCPSRNAANPYRFRGWEPL